MTLFRISFWLAFSFWLIGYGSIARAQLSFGDSDQPILVKAEQATYQGIVTLLEGDVQVTQGKARITSDQMKIYRKKLSGTQETGLSLGEVTRIVATGNFRYMTEKDIVTGYEGTYTRANSIITVTGNVNLSQSGKSQLKGEKLIYDLNTKRAKIDAGNGRVNFGYNPEDE